MKKHFLFLLSLLFSLIMQAQNYVAFKSDNGKYGYKDSLGIVIEPTYEYAYNFSEGMGIVYQATKYGCIDVKGNQVIPLKYEDAKKAFHNGLAGFKSGGKWGFLNKSGKEVIPFIHIGVSDFSENTARLTEGYDKEYMVDNAGVVLFPIDQYDELKDCENGLIKARKENMWGCLDKTGKEVIPFDNDNMYIQPDGGVAVEQTGKWGYIDNTFQLIIPRLYGNAMSFKEGLAAVQLDDKWGFIDKTGKTIIPFLYDEWWGGFTNGIATVKLNEEKFDIDKTGKRTDGKKPVAAAVPEKKPVSAIPLTDTVFRTLGIKFGFPKGYKISGDDVKSNHLNFYKADSSIILSVYYSVAAFETQSADWDEGSKTPAADGWYKNTAQIATKEYGYSKPVFVSDYFYPFAFGGADCILIKMVTKVKDAGLKEFDAVKNSVQRRPLPLVKQDIVPGVFTMGVPAYLYPKTGNLYGNVSIYTDEYNFLYFKLSDSRSVMGSLGAMLEHKEWKTGVGFKEKGSISFSSPSGIGFVGYWGLEPDLFDVSEESYKAYVFFEKPGIMGSEFWFAEYRLGKAIPTSMVKDIEEFMKTIKVKAN